MNINQSTHYKINNSTKTQNTAGERNPTASSSFGDVLTISKEAQMISAADQSHVEHLTPNTQHKIQASAWQRKCRHTWYSDDCRPVTRTARKYVFKVYKPGAPLGSFSE